MPVRHVQVASTMQDDEINACDNYDGEKDSKDECL
jgi:hypothetical protein